MRRCCLQATETREVDADYNPDFLRHIYPRIDWPTLRKAAETLGATAFYLPRLAQTRRSR